VLSAAVQSFDCQAVVNISTVHWWLGVDGCSQQAGLAVVVAAKSCGLV